MVTPKIQAAASNGRADLSLISAPARRISMLHRAMGRPRL